MRYSQKAIYRAVMVLAICLFILVNLNMGRLERLFGMSLDFTGEQFYSLSDATRTAVSALQSQTWIYVLSEEVSYPPVLSEILRRYSFLSPYLNVRYVDPYTEFVFLDYYNRQGFPIRESDILVEGSKGTRHIPAADIFRQDGRGRASGLFMEERLTNALIYADTGSSFSASFTVGHGESPEALTELLSDSGFSVSNLALLAGQRPEADVIVIAGPERDFLPEGIAALDSYMADGGKLLVFLGPGATRLPELEAFLYSWGLSLMPGVIMELLAHIPGNPAAIIPLYGMHEINMDFAQRQYFLAMPGTRALDIAEDSGDVRITRLLLSTRDSYARIGMDSSARSSGDLDGPFVLAVAAEKSSGAALMLFGSNGIYNADILAIQAYANREFLANSALWLAGGTDHNFVSIPPKTLAPPSVNAGFGVILAVLLVFAIMLPLAILVTGIVTLWRRRR